MITDYTKMTMGEMNKIRSKKLQDVIKPIEEFMNENCTPHDILVITQGRAELFTGSLSIKLEILD